VKLVDHKRIQLVWVLGYVLTDGNKIADQMAWKLSPLPLI